MSQSDSALIYYYRLAKIIHMGRLLDYFTMFRDGSPTMVQTFPCPLLAISDDKDLPCLC